MQAKPWRAKLLNPRVRKIYAPCPIVVKCGWQIDGSGRFSVDLFILVVWCPPSSSSLCSCQICRLRPSPVVPNVSPPSSLYCCQMDGLRPFLALLSATQSTSLHPNGSLYESIYGLNFPHRHQVVAIWGFEPSSSNSRDCLMEPKITPGSPFLTTVSIHCVMQFIALGLGLVFKDLIFNYWYHFQSNSEP